VLSSVASIYFLKFVNAICHLQSAFSDESDLHNEGMQEKKNFEKLLDHEVAHGLEKGIAGKPLKVTKLSQCSYSQWLLK
jgi:hypothetical protein